MGVSIPTSRIWLLPAGIFLLGLALRLYCLDCYGFWGDEVASIEGARLGVQGFTGGCFGWICNQTSLHYLLVWLTIQPVEPALTGALVRLPSAVASVIAVARVASWCSSVPFSRSIPTAAAPAAFMRAGPISAASFQSKDATLKKFAAPALITSSKSPLGWEKQASRFRLPITDCQLFSLRERRIGN